MSEWKPVDGFSDYQVSVRGEVKRNETGHIITPQINQFGTVFVCPMRDARQFQRSLALLVAKAHIPNPRAPVFDTPINLDGDRWNCAVENLEWRPLWFARRYHQQFRVVYPYGIENPIRLVGSAVTFVNSRDAAISNGLLESDVVESIHNATVTWPFYQKFEEIF